MPSVGFTMDIDSGAPGVVDDEPETNNVGVAVADAPSLIHTSTGTQSSDTSSSIEYKTACQLFELAQQQEWSALVTHIQSCSPWVFQQAVMDPVDGSTTLLHVLLANANNNANANDNVLLKTVIQTMLQKDSRLALVHNHMQQTPLHVAVQCIPDHLDIIQCLISAAPETVQQRDCQYLRPIDITCQKIIMKEELIKYNMHTTYTTHDRQFVLVHHLWECARLLAQASRRCYCSCLSTTTRKEDASTSTTTDQIQAATAATAIATIQEPMVHACLQAVDFPLALTKRAMKRYIQQLGQADATGDLPLHIMARQAPPSHEGEGDGDDMLLLLLGELIASYPAAAKEWNHQRQIPLDVAIASGRTWRTGIRQLLEAHPAGIESRGISVRVYPLILEKLIQEEEFQIIFGILKGKPELYQQHY
jgi:ankyrin repeat protein